MKLNMILQRLSAVTVILAITLSLPALAQHTGAAHGAPVHRGGPVYHGYRDGGVWWGVGLGLGLGWEAAYYDSPYSWYYYPPYPYAAPTAVIVPSPTPAQVNWYYCDSLKNYYPAVGRCPEQWRVIPATPPNLPASAPAPLQVQPAH